MKATKPAKRSKASVGYKDGLPQAHCGICRHYQGGRCSLVAGEISPNMWCRLFARRK